MLNVSETFVSYQGEGPATGRKTFFLRLAGCNLACSWCDSKFSWSLGDAQQFTADLLLEELKQAESAFGVNNVCITGGEPLLQQNSIHFRDFIDQAGRMGMDVEIETNGTVLPSPYTIRRTNRFNISPKLMAMGANDPINPMTLKEIDNAIWLETSGSCEVAVKFVVTPSHWSQCKEEIDEINECCNIPDEDIWLMPLGTKDLEVIENTKFLMEATHNWNVTTRSQIIFKFK